MIIYRRDISQLANFFDQWTADYRAFDALVNSYRTPREEINRFPRFFE